jgi:hypothetical protein
MLPHNIFMSISMNCLFRPVLGPIWPPYLLILSVLSIEAADAWGWSLTSVRAVCSFKCAIPECLHGVHRDIYTCSIVLEEWLKYLHGRNSVPQKMSAIWSHVTVCHSGVLCCVKTQSVVVSWSVSSMETWKILCIWLFILCNAHLQSLSLSFSSAVAL